jgi:hypothetical protein
VFLQEHFVDSAIFLSGSSIFTMGKSAYRYVAERVGLVRNCRNGGGGKTLRSELLNFPFWE